MDFMDTLKDLKSRWKTTGDYIEESKAKVKPGVIPAKHSKAQIEEMQLKNERARNPKEFDAKKAMYESALKQDAEGMKKGGKVKCMSKGGSASSRADGIAVRGKTRGTIC